MSETKQLMGPIDFQSYFFILWKSVSLTYYFLLCLCRRKNSNNFWTTWGWGNDDRI